MSTNDNTSPIGPLPNDSRDELDLFDPVALNRLSGDEAANAETKESFNVLDTLFERVRIPDEMAPTVASDHRGQAASHSEPPRLQLSGFEQKSILGSGGFGTVFLAHDVKLERDVAVKVPRTDKWLGSDERDRFLEEARLAAKLKHPGIVTLLELVENGERYHLVSELVDGETLQDVLERGKIDWRETSQIAQTVAEAIEHAHTNHVIHRDLKPTNILLDAEGNPKIADFGLAIRREAKSAAQVLAAGTLEYMSPEQLPDSESSIDQRTDIWSFGVVLYEMLTGKLPFRGETRQELFDAIKNESPSPPRTFDGSIPKDLERICLRCLRKSPSDRFTSASEISAELTRINNRVSLTPIGLLQRMLLAGLFCAAAVTIATMLIRGEGGIAQQKIAASMRINHLRFSPDGLAGMDFGPIGERSTQVLEDDSINISVSFSEPAYFRLLELTSSGQVQTHYSTDPKGDPVKEIEFPLDRNADLQLADGPGSCVIAVVCSREPLEPMTAEQIAAIDWSPRRHEGIWQYNNGRFFQMVIPDRSQVAKRIAAPELVSAACRQLDGDNVSVCAIAFPVQQMPRKEPR